QTAIDPATGVHRLLNRHFVRGAFEQIATGTGIEPLVILADDDEVDMLRPLVLERAILRSEEFHGAKVDVLLELKTEAEQDSFFENARLDLGMAHGAQKDRLELPQFVDGAVRQHLACLEVTVAAQ